MLCILMRYQAGECLAALSRIYGVSPQTIGRWQKAWGDDTQHVHVARLAVLQQHNFDEAAKTVETLRDQVGRAHAVLSLIARKNVARNPGVVMAEELQEAVPQRHQKPGAYGGRLFRKRATTPSE